MPISTPPNAIVYSSGYIPIGAMMRAGVVLDVIGYFLPGCDKGERQALALGEHRLGKGSAIQRQSDGAYSALAVIIILKVIVREVIKLYQLLDGFTLHEEARSGGVSGL
jgi:hypothetical protein